MNGALQQKRRSLRELYRNSSDRISLALTLFGIVRQDATFEIQRDNDFKSIANLIETVLNSHSTEEENDYRTLILNVCKWLTNAYQKEYLIQNKTHTINIMYVVRRGIEVLHLLLHRDLRRRVLTPTESQLVYEFKNLAAKFPTPKSSISEIQSDTAADIIDNLENLKLSKSS